MPLLLSRKELMAGRMAVCLLVVGCSQSALETYGCACASRTYTAEELAGYRAGAARGELPALEEMEEYYHWRAAEHDRETPDYVREDRQRRHYRALRIARKDPDVLTEEADSLMMAAAFDDLPRDRQLASLRRARDYIRQIPHPTRVIDLKDPARQYIDPVRYLDREIAALEGSLNS